MNPCLHLLIVAATILWTVPFVRSYAHKGLAVRLDRRARWGVLLECLGYSLLWQGSFWTGSPQIWRVALSSALLAIACLLSWTSARALGRHLRVDAALQSDHELVTDGPYRFVRHPIYASMLCLLLGTGLLIAPVYLLLFSVAVFLIGTEIRMQVEERLLAERFGAQFTEYCSRVSALIPFWS